MKKSLLILASIFFMVNIAKAQLTTGSIAPDFKLFEIDKTTGNLITTDTIHLYEYLDAGKPTMLDFSATWCPPCWSYHNGHAMKTAYESYGPNGTDQLRVLFIEGDAGNYSSLTGGPDADGYASQGDWLDGTPYPVIPTKMSPNTNAVVRDYKIAAFPTLYMVCPNRKVLYIDGRPNAAGILAYANLCPVFQEIQDNASIFNIILPNDKHVCANNITPQVVIQNIGTANLTSAVLTMNIDGTDVPYTWTGNLEKYATDTLFLPALEDLTNGSHTFTITIDTVNGVEDVDIILNSVSKTFTIQKISTLTSVANQTFSSSTFPPTNWERSGEEYWTRYSSNQAIYFLGRAIPQGDSEALILPLLSNNNSNKIFAFDVANALYSRNPGKVDTLKVMISKDCDENWVTVYNKSNDLPTTDVHTDNQYDFFPETNDWRTEYVDLTNYLNDVDNFLIKIEAISGKAGIIWLDNISYGVKIPDNVTERENEMRLTIFPNPANDRITILAEDNPIQRVELYNIQGQLIKNQQLNDNTVDISDLSAGMYSVRIITEKGVAVKNIIKK